MAAMKVWQLTDSDWWMAPTLEDAIQAAMKMYGLPRDEVSDGDSVEVSEEAMDKMKFVYDGLQPVNRTYREEFNRRMEENPVTQHFASSDW